MLRDKNGQVWTSANVSAEKLRVRNELDQGDAAGSESKKRAARLRRALQRVEDLADETSDEAMLSRFVYAMSALVQHEAHGGLKGHQMRGLLEIVHGILRVKVPRPATSRLANLYGDYYLLRSQLARQDGLHWKAAWDQQMSCHVSGRVLSQGEARQDLAAAIRTLRMAEGARALALFTKAEQGGLPLRQWVRARLGQIQALRLSCEWDQCRSLIEETQKHEDLTDLERRDLAWHTLCLDAQVTGRLEAMTRAVAPRGTHHEASYFLECVLWTRASGDREARDRLPTLASQARSRSLKVHGHGLFYRCVEALEACYDATIPFHLRLERLGRTLEKRSGLISIDKELLLLASAAVWLTRSRATSLADLTSGEYAALCRRLSNGKSADVLHANADDSGIVAA